MIVAPARLAASTAITVSTGFVVTPVERSSDARSASTWSVVGCADSAVVCTESGEDAPAQTVCLPPSCTLGVCRVVSAGAPTWDVAP